MEKTCTKCGIVKPFSEYYSYKKRGEQVLHAHCIECHKTHIQRTYQSKVNSVNKYKATNGCVKCGDLRYYLLDFHHRDPSKKDFTISDKTRCSLHLLMEEISKCVLLCANCHREFHHLEREANINIDTYLT